MQRYCVTLVSNTLLSGEGESFFDIAGKGVYAI
jgi:hypothetical protein